MKFSVAGLLFCVIWITMFDNTRLASTEGVLDKIKAGLQHASNYLETAKEIADLVSKNLDHKQKQKRGEDGDDQAKLPPFGPSNLVSAFFRLIGLDSSKVTAIAINGVIFLAQMIGSLLGMTRPQGNVGRNTNEGLIWDPLKFILENKNERVRDLVDQARNANLSDRLAASISGADLVCVRLVICKSSPIIKAAQNSLNNKPRTDRYRITAWLPSKEEFERNSDKCEDEYPDCSLFATR